MFLSDKLQTILLMPCTDETQLVYSLLNACVHNIAEKTHIGMSVKDCATIIKQTDNCWRLFCKEHGFKNGAELFKEAYINERCKFHPQLKNYFK